MQQLQMSKGLLRVFLRGHWVFEIMQMRELLEPKNTSKRQ